MDNPRSCALDMARRAWPGLRSYQLVALAHSHGLDTRGHHRALTDCALTLPIYCAAAAQPGAWTDEALCLLPVFRGTYAPPMTGGSCLTPLRRALTLCAREATMETSVVLSPWSLQPSVTLGTSDSEGPDGRRGQSALTRRVAVATMTSLVHGLRSLA